jgi:ubiquinol-cytochrome c reductase cytochrome c subunit
MLVIVAGLLLSGGIFTAVVNTTAQADETASSEELVAQGRELFLVSCAFCHGQNGEGVSTEDGGQLGPSLVGVGEAAVDFQVGTGRMPMAQPGAQVPAKQETFDD